MLSTDLCCMFRSNCLESFTNWRGNDWETSLFHRLNILVWCSNFIVAAPIWKLWMLRLPKYSIDCWVKWSSSHIFVLEECPWVVISNCQIRCHYFHWAGYISFSPQINVVTYLKLVSPGVLNSYWNYFGWRSGVYCHICKWEMHRWIKGGLR